MAFDFDAWDDRIAELLRHAGPLGVNADSDQLIAACKAAGHRRHFFVDIGSALSRRGQTIFRAIEAHDLLPVRGKPGKPQCQSLCENKPLSLSGVIKLDNALRAIAEHDSPDVVEITNVRGRPLTLAPDTLVASVYYARPSSLMDLRIRTYGSNRNAASEAIFGVGNWNTLRLLEHGDQHNRHARVTRATVDRMADVLGEQVYNYFSCNADAGPKDGDGTFALQTRWGNRLSYRRENALAAGGA